MAFLALAASCAAAGDPRLREEFSRRAIASIAVGEVKNAGGEIRLPAAGLFKALFSGKPAQPEERRALEAVETAVRGFLYGRGFGGTAPPGKGEATLDVEVTLFDARRLPDRREARFGGRFRLRDARSGETLWEKEIAGRTVSGIHTARADDFEPYVERFVRDALRDLPARR